MTNARKVNTEKKMSCHASPSPHAATTAAATAPTEKHATAKPAVNTSKIRKNNAIITHITHAESTKSDDSGSIVCSATGGIGATSNKRADMDKRELIIMIQN